MLCPVLRKPMRSNSRKALAGSSVHLVLLFGGAIGISPLPAINFKLKRFRITLLRAECIPPDLPARAGKALHSGFQTGS
jgi:hypothetical protein